MGVRQAPGRHPPTQPVLMMCQGKGPAPKGSQGPCHGHLTGPWRCLPSALPHIRGPSSGLWMPVVLQSQVSEVEGDPQAPGFVTTALPADVGGPAPLYLTPEGARVKELSLSLGCGGLL